MNLWNRSRYVYENPYINFYEVKNIYKIELEVLQPFSIITLSRKRMLRFSNIWKKMENEKYGYSFYEYLMKPISILIAKVVICG